MLRVMSSSKQLGITGENSVVGSDSSIVSVNVTAGNLKCNSQNYNKGLGEEPTSSLALASAATSLSGSSSRGGGLSNGICRGTTTATATASTAHAHSHSYSCAGDYVTISASHSGVPTATATATPTKSFAPVSSPAPVAAAVGTEGGTDATAATAVPQPGRYNGIFLVDGLGHGVRIERQIQMESSPSIGGVYEYGLPVESGFQMRERQYFPGYVGGQEIPNPVCIRIDGTTTAAAVGSEIGLDANVAKFSGHGSYFQGECPAGGAIIPVVPGSSSYVGKAMNRNSVTLPVPSPPPHGNGNIGVELNGGGGIGIPGINPKSQSSESLTTTERTLISTEAQTEDLPTTTTAMAALPPPPPPSRNREQRKRERRERRRADRNLNQNPNYHFSGQSTGSRPGAVGPGPSRNGCQTSNTTENNNVIYANATTISGDEHQQQQSRNGNSHGFCENGQFQGQSQGQGQLGLPDLLNSHLPPPYSTLPQTCERRVGLGFSGNVPLHGAGMNHPHPPMQIQGLPIQGFVPPMLPPPQPMLGLGSGPPQAVCLASPPQPVRYHFAPTRASRRSLRTPRGVPYASEEEPKSCCGMSTSQAVSIRWFIIVIAVIGICCTVAGTALGAARSAGSQHLTLSLLMIGVGVVLLTVSAVAWRLTANESGTSCRAMLGFARNGSSRGDGGAEPNRRFVPRLAPSYGRPHHPYAAMMYPDFQYRPPPPSYQASMQEYRLRLLLLERSNPTIAAAAGLTNPISSSMVPPPPAYRPYTSHHRPGGLRHDADFTRPPSYRSRSSGGYDNSPGSRPSMVPGLDHPHQSHMMDSPIHSRDPSILSYLSQQSMADNVSVVSGAGNRGQGNSNSAVVTVMQAVSVGMDLGMMSPMTYDPAVRDGPEAGDSKELPESNEDEGLVVVGGIKGGGLHCEKSRSKDGNLVRIVQTTDSSQVIGRNSSSVIVTVSGSNHSLWDQSLQNAVNNNTNSTNGSNHSHVGSPGTENNEVQILAHL